MSLQIIIRGRNTYGKTRAEQESNLRKDGLHGMSDEHLDKARWIEKKLGVKHGFVRATELTDIK